MFSSDDLKVFVVDSFDGDRREPFFVRVARYDDGKVVTLKMFDRENLSICDAVFIGYQDDAQLQCLYESLSNDIPTIAKVFYIETKEDLFSFLKLEDSIPVTVWQEVAKGKDYSRMIEIHEPIDIQLDINKEPPDRCQCLTL